MSEVISFRLNKDNPREARALRVLKKWREEGHNTRYIITEALNGLKDLGNIELKSLMLVELNERLFHISRIFEQMGHQEPNKLFAITQSTSDIILSDCFINSIKEAAKPGIRLE